MDEFNTSSTKRSVTPLTLLTCFWADFPDTSDRIDCSTSDPSLCLSCPVLGKFSSSAEESMNDYHGPGHSTSKVLLVIAFIIALFGTVANLFIILILKKRPNQRPFEVLLIVLAWCDLLSCISTAVTSVSAIVIFQNCSRGQAAMWIGVYFGLLTTIYGRSLSSYMTLLIAIERYLILKFPFKCWLTRSKIKICTICVIVWSTLMAFPRYSSHYIKRNDLNVPSLRDFDYIPFPTPLAKFWFGKLKGLHNLVDFWLPLPLLLVFNGLIFYHIHKFAEKRNTLSKNMQRDINATVMFAPVVVVLLLCNIEPIVFYYHVLVDKIVYREHYWGVLISLAINSSVNLAIYYFRGTSFRKEAKDLVTLWCSSIATTVNGLRPELTSTSAMQDAP